MNKITKEILIEEGFEHDENLSKWILKNNNSIVAPEIYWDKNGFFIDCKMYPGLSLNNEDSKRYLKTIDELKTCYCEAYIDKEWKD